MKEKFYQNRLLFLGLCFFLIFFGCKKSIETKKEHVYGGYVSMNAPMYYYALRPMVTVFHQRKMLGGISTNVIGNQTGWRGIDYGLTTNYTGLVPDSLFVEWSDIIDECRYEAGVKLPHVALTRLFQTKFQGKLQEEYFNNINIGIAPGGNVCIFVNHLELLRLKANCIRRDTVFNSVKLKNEPELINYLKHHPVDYSIWEKPDPRYELDFGFCSENNLTHFNFIYYISIEGIRNVVFKEQIDLTSWDIPYGIASNLIAKSYIQKGEEFSLIKKHLPVEVQIGWGSKNQSYYTHVVLPENFNKQFTQPYLNPITGLKSNFNRLVFGVENDGKHCVVWLDGPEKQKKIMRFEGSPSKKDKNGVYLNKGGYATEIEYFDSE